MSLLSACSMHLFEPFLLLEKTPRNFCSSPLCTYHQVHVPLHKLLQGSSWPRLLRHFRFLQRLSCHCALPAICQPRPSMPIQPAKLHAHSIHQLDVNLCNESSSLISPALVVLEQVSWHSDTRCGFWLQAKGDPSCQTSRPNSVSRLP